MYFTVCVYVDVCVCVLSVVCFCCVCVCLQEGDPAIPIYIPLSFLLAKFQASYRSEVEDNFRDDG